MIKAMGAIGSRFIGVKTSLNSPMYLEISVPIRAPKHIKTGAQDHIVPKYVFSNLIISLSLPL